MTDIEKLVRMYRAEMIKLGFNVRPILKVDITRTARGMGWCYQYGDGGVKILINKYLIKVGGEELKETILHELCHAVYGCVDHGAEWKRVAKKVGTCFNIKIEQHASAEKVTACRQVGLARPKFIVCAECGAKYSYFRKGKTVKYIEAGNKDGRYSCSHCGSSHLVLE